MRYPLCILPRLSLSLIPLVLCMAGTVHAGPLRAGAAKVDVTHPGTETRNEKLYVRALVITDDETTGVIITVDAVAIGEIGPIKNSYLPTVRAQLEREFHINPMQVMANASHCHGIVCDDVAEKTVEAVRAAREKLVPVQVGVGIGHENRIQENRRLKLTNGREADVRHAYSLPPDVEIAGVGPIDPQIGVLRLDNLKGETVAVVYNFACHPIQGVPGGTNTADITGFASRVIEDNLSAGAIALFIQGCGGDINPVQYKDTDHPRDAETLGNLLGLSTLKAVRKIECRETDRFTFLNEPLELPRADLALPIEALKAEQLRLAQSLGGTSLNLKTFLPLVVKYKLSAEYPSSYPQGYLQQQAIGRDDLAHLDVENRKNIAAYIKNIYIMEELTRVRTNLALLEKHHTQNLEASSRMIDVELVGLRIGDFVLVTSPGELTVQIGLNIKQASPHKPTFVAGYTNGYIYYAATAEQLANRGGAQEDSDSILAPEWQKIFEDKVAEVLKKL